MWTKIGIGSVLAGFFIWVFGIISSFMSVDNMWVGLTLSGLLGEFADTLVTFIPVAVVENALTFLVFDLPLYGLILGIGGVSFVIGMVMNEKG